MALLINGYSDYTARVRVKIFNFKFAAALDLNKYLKQIKLLFTFAPISELPSNISTMIQTDICL